MKTKIEHASVVAMIVFGCCVIFLSGLAVGQSTAPPMTLEQHDKMMTAVNHSNLLYLRLEAIQKKYSDACTGQMNQDPEYKSLADEKGKADTDVQSELNELYKGVDTKQWLINMTTGHWEKPQPPAPQKKE